jgi:hypothetical protein
MTSHLSLIRLALVGLAQIATKVVMKHESSKEKVEIVLWIVGSGV